MERENGVGGGVDQYPRPKGASNSPRECVLREREWTLQTFER